MVIGLAAARAAKLPESYVRMPMLFAMLAAIIWISSMQHPAIAQMPPESGGPVDPAVIDDLVVASRILFSEGVLDGLGHVSIRHPTNPNRFLMSRSIAPALMTAEDIIEYDLDCNPVNANGRASFVERFIHGEIYKARRDVNAVIHSHSPAVIPFGIRAFPDQVA